MKKTFYHIFDKKESRKTKDIVYCIVIGKHTYVGSTKRTAWERIREHERALEKGSHYNKRMQFWFNTYKQATIIILDSSENVRKSEQWYIDQYNPDINIIRKVS